MKPVPNAITFCERLGFKFQLDWDDELEIVMPPRLTPEAVRGLLLEYAHDIAASLRLRVMRQRQQYVGGPANGQPHRGFRDDILMKHVGRAQWAVYVVGDDGRAFFHGIETNRKKAMLCGWAVVQKARVARWEAKQSTTDPEESET